MISFSVKVDEKNPCRNLIEKQVLKTVMDAFDSALKCVSKDFLKSICQDSAACKSDHCSVPFLQTTLVLRNGWRCPSHFIILYHESLIYKFIGWQMTGRYVVH